jgi:hypothetical protein
MTGSSEDIALRQVGVPATETIYRRFVLASLGLAVLVGFVLGIQVPVSRLLDGGNPARTADLIQAHGQVQLLGFAGLFVMGMSFRLTPRFAGSRLAFEPLAAVTLGLFILGLVLRAVVMPWSSGDSHSAIMLASVLALLFGSACYSFIIFGTLTVEARRFDASSLAFILGSFLLFGAATIAAFVAIDAIDAGVRGLSYLANTAVLHLQLAGFLFLFILGVAVRAIPTMVGVERPGRSSGALALALATSVVVFATALLYLEYGSYSRGVIVLADISLVALGIVLLMLAWQAGVLRQAANRLRPASQANLWLIRSAFVWLVVAAAIAVYVGATSLFSAQLPSQTDFDAIRHVLGLGVVTMLIAGMSIMILPEFAIERQRPNRQALLALGLVTLLNIAVILRVAPALTPARWSLDERDLSIALAGAFAEVALLTFAAYLLRLLLRQSAFRSS